MGPILPATLLLATTVLAGSPAEDEGGRTPVPDATREVFEARELVRDLYTEPFADESPAGRRALVDLLRAKAGEAAVGSVTHWVLVDEALDAALGSGDVRLALGVLDEVCTVYAVDRVRASLEAFEELEPGAGDLAAVLVAERCLALADRAARAGADEAAGRLLSIAAEIARELRHDDLRERARAAEKSRGSYRGLHAKAERARRKLAAEPDDPSAHLDVARLVLNAEEDWDEGLAHLTHAARPALRELAALDRDLSGGDRAGEREVWLELGRRWRDTAAKERDRRLREPFYRRADAWFARCQEVADDPLEREALARERDAFQARFGPDERFLADLRPTALHVAFGELGRNGWMGHGTDQAAIGGLPVLNSLGAHAGTGDDVTFLRYDLRRAWKELAGGAGLGDSNGGVTTYPLTFEILGDGELLWRSEPVQRREDVRAFEVPVEGVKELELRIVCSGLNRSAHTIWIEPRLSR